ncbi:hypothetical protein JOC37_001869 [Desulfohalotomaculum tongense]|uniref:M23 family metallopeptidase n=1 Tax=Desulforadius tongensis TaxID=1216062 RepID=UPI00195E8DDC|nr:M23 family metallopeptidase [Desulforadius tongensis]MBM7855472.1 hypothetical protein [Desulforadius tongensis]
MFRSRRFNIDNLWWLGFVGLLGTVYQPLKPFKFFYLFFLLPLISLILKFVKMSGKKRKELADYCIAVMNGMFFNPYLSYQALLHTFGQLLAILRCKGNLPSPENYHQKTKFSLPFEGFWTIENGGISKEVSHSWDIVNQRYAYDFVIKDEQGKTYKNNGKKLEDYYAFGKPILVPADGVVIQMRNDAADYFNIGHIDWKTKDFRGNFVVIRHAKNEYSFLAHLKQGSIRVEVGDRVKRGQVIGLCGNSGYSTEPHLHFHVQDHPNFFLAVSLPIKFSNFCLKELNAVKHTKCGYIVTEQQIANNQSSEAENVY